MVQLPQALIQSLQGVEGFNREAFIDVHQSGETVTSIRINPAKSPIANLPSPINPVPWSQYGYYLAKRPSFTFDPLFHAGLYYVQEASSMFLEQAITQTVDLFQPLKVLDLCAAPGGKSTHLQSLLSPDSLLVSNEVIKARSGSLKQNIIKWGCGNVVVTANDPQHFQKLPHFFDVLVVDAPCSGSGLFRKDENAVNKWSPEAVQLCSGRQQRILRDALPVLKSGGVLVYSTCSFSPEENEDVLDWLVKEEGLESIQLKLQKDWNIVETTAPLTHSFGYRFYPDKLQGEGFFIACFRKVNDGDKQKPKTIKPVFVSQKEKEILRPWIVLNQQLAFLKQEAFVFALPQKLVENFAILQAHLYIQYAGVNIGEAVRDKLLPHHALALSSLLSEGVPATEVELDTAIRYLQRADVNMAGAKRGWGVVTYKNHPLGWINTLPNRINNYYPKDLRILKAHNDSDLQK